MPNRKFKLAELDAHFVTWDGRDDHPPDAIYFRCPEGHEDCAHIIPFTPDVEGNPRGVQQRNGAKWDRHGAATIEALTLTPSIRRNPSHASREAAIKAGCLPEHVTEALLCAFHGFIKNGAIEFCSDSR